MCSSSPDYGRIMAGLWPDLVFSAMVVKIIIPKIFVISI
jgi:hypothetical protein